MTELKSTAIIFCVSAIVSAITYFLVPEGSAKKIYSHIISLFMLLVLLIPVLRTDMSVFGISSEKHVNDDKNEEYSVMLDEYILDSGEDITATQIDNCVKELCKHEFRTDVVFEFDSSGAAVLKSVLIVIDARDAVYSRAIINKVGQITGVIPEVQIYDE